MNTLTFASHNANKAGENSKLARLFVPDINFISLSKDVPDVDETGVTFEENATLKAVTQAQRLGVTCLGEDSGLSVNSLNGLPGVWSARFCNAEFNREEGRLIREKEVKLQGAEREAKNNELLLSWLAKSSNREAQMKVCFVLALPNGEIPYVHTYDYDVTIIEEERGKNGFAYDKVMTGHNTDGRTLAELEHDEKVLLGPRYGAMKKFCEWILQHKHLLD